MEKFKCGDTRLPPDFSLFSFLLRLLRFCYHLSESNTQLVSIKLHQLNRGNDGISYQALHQYANHIHTGGRNDWGEAK